MDSARDALWWLCGHDRRARQGDAPDVHL